MTPVQRLFAARAAALVYIACIGLASVAHAQDATDATATSALTGIIHDPAGRVVVGAKIVATAADVGKRWEATSTSIGYFEMTLPQGSYAVFAAFSGLSWSGKIRIEADEKYALDIDLEAGRFVDDVTVRGMLANPGLFGARGTLGGTFSHEEINTMPLSSGRTLQSLLGLVPGIVITDSVGTLAQFTATGQRRFSNRLTIDGVSADLSVDLGTPGPGTAGNGTLPAYNTLGTTQTIIPMAAIDTIEIKTTNTSPEQARSPGAQTIVVTRAGTNRLSGDAFADSRLSRLAADDWFVNAGQLPKHATALWTAGASLGGPLLPGRIVFRTSMEHVRVDRIAETTISVPSAASRDSVPGSIRSVVDAFPQPNGPEIGQGLAEFSGRFQAASELTTVSARLDVNLSAGHRLFVRANGGNSRGDEVDPILQVPRVSFSLTAATATRIATAGLKSTFVRLATNDLRANISSHGGALTATPTGNGDAQPLPLSLFIAPGTDPEDASVQSILVAAGNPGALLLGRLGASHVRQIEISDTLVLSRGRHEWQIGGDYRQLTFMTKPAGDSYTYRFNNMSDVENGRVRWLLVQHNLPARSRGDAWSAFAQDSVRVAARLTLQYGVRYSLAPAPVSTNGIQPVMLDVDMLPELEVRPAGSRLWHTSWWNLAPAVSAAYQAGRTHGRETTISAGWRMSFDESASTGARVFGRGFPYVSRRVITSAQFPVSSDVLVTAFPEPFSAGDRAQYFAIDSNLRPPRTYEWHVGVDQAIAFPRGDRDHRSRVSVAYVGTAARDLTYWSAYPVDRASLAQINVITNDAYGEYHALQVASTYGIRRDVQASIAYTWSHAIDNDSGESLTPNPPPTLVSPHNNRGSADFDRRHVFRLTASVGSAVWRLPRWLESLCPDIDVAVSLHSGAPLTVTAPRDLGFGAFTLRPDLVAGVPIWIADPLAPSGLRLNPSAFELPTEARQGSLGRNTIRGAGLRQIDLFLTRTFPVHGRGAIRLRLEIFNLLNTPNFAAPEGVLFADGFGQSRQSYADRLGSGTLMHGGMLPLLQLGGPRSVQFGLRFDF